MTIDVGLSITAINNASAPLRAVTKDVEGLGWAAQATHNRLKAIQVVIAGIVLNKTLELGKAFTEVAAKNQLSDIQLQSWMGTAKDASAVMEHFSKTIAASGVDNNDLATSFGRLRAAGISTQDATRTIDNLVNGLAALGSKDISGSLDNVVSSFQRFASKGVVSTREFNAMVRGTGLTLKELADASGKSTKVFYNELEKKLLDAQDLLDAFNKAAEQKFGGFVTLLGSTVGGALNKFKFDFDDAIGNMGRNTDLDAHIALIFQNIDKAVITFINHISKKDIERFFQFIADQGPILADVGTLIVDVASAVLKVGEVSSKLLNMMPDEAVEFGIIGYVLGGKKFALFGAILGALDKTIHAVFAGLVDGIGYALDAFKSLTGKGPGGDLSHKAADILRTTDSLTLLGAALDGINGTVGHARPKQNWLQSIIGTDADLEKLKKDLAEIGSHKFIAPGGLTDNPVTKDNSALLKAMNEMRQRAKDALASAADNDAMLQMQISGDQLGQTVQGIQKTSNGWLRTLEDIVVQLHDSKLSLAEQNVFIDAIHKSENSINADTEAMIENAKILNDLRQEGVRLSEQQAVLSLKMTMLSQNNLLNNLHNNTSAFFSGTAGGKAQLEVDQQILQYKQQILQYEEQINHERENIQNDQMHASGYEKTIADLQSAIDLTQQLADATNTSTVMMKDFYSQLGQSMENDVASGITGLIEGTMSWGDVGRQVFGDMISLSVKFLVQLLEQQLFAQTAAAASIAASAPIAAAQAAIWGPAAMAASIATFGAADAVGTTAYMAAMASSIIPLAKGGIPGVGELSGSILRGPTMFLGGEAGDEAVMPLTRVGGKLGVRTSGGGGNHYHITVQAIDTQTGLDFIAKHIDHIDAGLHQSQQLNLRAGQR